MLHSGHLLIDAIPLHMALMTVDSPDVLMLGRHLQRWMYLEMWRWCIFAACFMPIYYLSEMILHCGLILVEANTFALHNALYYVVSIRVRPGHLSAPLSEVLLCLAHSPPQMN